MNKRFTYPSNINRHTPGWPEFLGVILTIILGFAAWLGGIALVVWIVATIIKGVFF